MLFSCLGKVPQFKKACMLRADSSLSSDGGGGDFGFNQWPGKPTTHLPATCSAQEGWNPGRHRHAAAQKPGWPTRKEGKPCPNTVSKWGQQVKFPGQLGKCVHKMTVTLVLKIAVEIIIIMKIALIDGSTHQELGINAYVCAQATLGGRRLSSEMGEPPKQSEQQTPLEGF